VQVGEPTPWRGHSFLRQFEASARRFPPTDILSSDNESIGRTISTSRLHFDGTKGP
jgi:hypothetical protein